MVIPFYIYSSLHIIATIYGTRQHKYKIKYCELIIFMSFQDVYFIAKNRYKVDAGTF